MSLFQANTTPVIDIDSVKQKFLKPDGTIDTESLLKKAAHADAHIQKLEQEQAGLRSDLESRLTLEKAVEQIKATTNPQQSHETPVVASQHQMTNENVSKLSPEEIQKMINQRIDQERNNTLKANNVAKVQAELMKAWGPGYAELLSKRASDLGLSQEFLGNLAETSPDAFLKVVQPSPFNTDTAPPQNRFNTAAMGISGETRNFKYYEKIRKESPSKYWEPRIQNEMTAQLSLLGDDFYK